MTSSITFVTLCALGLQLGRAVPSPILLQASLDQEAYAKQFHKFGKRLVGETSGPAFDSSDLVKHIADHKPFLLEELRSANLSDRSAAAYLLGKSNDVTVGKALMDVAKHDELKFVRFGAIDALADLRYRPAIPFLKELVFAPYSGTVWIAAGALYKVDPKAALGVYKTRLRRADDGKLDSRCIAKANMLAKIFESDRKHERQFVQHALAGLKKTCGDKESFRRLEKLLNPHPGLLRP